jgi:pyridoxamine 5'-phosphate oxidase family protein
MSVFTDHEIEYLRSQRLGRLATIGPDGDPHVVPVGFRYNAAKDSIDIGGHNFAARRKYRDMQRDSRVAFVVDDVLPPWRPRMIEIRGTVEFGNVGKTIMQGFDDEMIHLHPRRIVSFGIDSDQRVAGRDVGEGAIRGRQIGDAEAGKTA